MTAAPVHGVVLQGTGGVYQIHLADGTTQAGAMRGRLKREGGVKIAVGDDVLVEHDQATGGWTIVEILPRRSRLARRAPGSAHMERIVVTNVDQVVVVFAMVRPEPNAKMLDRFLVVAETNDVAARIVINKVDLDSRRAAEELFGGYAALGYPVHYTSTVTGDGLPELLEALRGRVSALSGPSGVGKSSLLNALYPGLDLRVGAISESVNKGRHTTVGARMHPLPRGGYVVDTPGLREVGLWGIAARDLERCFPEFVAVLGTCRFADCRHLSEPECGVRSAVDAGRIMPSRYESYVKLREEVEEVERTW
ncbi:MAG: ribosome small subunit-dependent GTPase A [Gemmatimonadetes bacterium]|nr:ribosome small subunit-dependent GTPase A [Gemmatimonadota bacterium]MCC6771398.1 ribosome small subunit-dependent GTPase A [Gemmatimonadaceae bacterium]